MRNNVHSKLVAISFLFAFLFFIGTPFEAQAQAPEFGCCRTPGNSNQCIGGQSWPSAMASEENCLDNNSNRTWLPFDICSGAPPTCGPATGCCAVPGDDGFLCDTENAEDCQQPGAQFFLDTECPQVEICQPAVTGCCITPNGCTISTDDGCDTFVPGALSCTADACLDPVGCCPNPQQFDICMVVAESECNGPVQVGLSCNDLGTCGPVGCCQRGDECALTIESDCQPPLQWFEQVECTQFGICENLLVGCCQESDAMCFDVSGGNPPCGDEDFMVGESCLPDMQCGEAVFGCCQQEDDVCAITSEFECPPDDFFPSLACVDDTTCREIPTGCCVCEDEACFILTEEQCVDVNDCTYLGDDTTCEGREECSSTPGCCFLNGDNGDGGGLPAEEGAARSVDPEKCVEVPIGECEALGGEFAGPATSCEDFPEECSDRTFRNVPTISQWGLIAMAGLLGIFSLIVIARRNKMNLNLR